jgi:hypothetical protein
MNVYQVGQLIGAFFACGLVTAGEHRAKPVAPCVRPMRSRFPPWKGGAAAYFPIGHLASQRLRRYAEDAPSRLSCVLAHSQADRGRL